MRHRRRTVWVKALTIALIYTFAVILPVLFFSGTIFWDIWADLDMGLSFNQFHALGLSMALALIGLSTFLIWQSVSRFIGPMRQIWRSVRASHVKNTVPIPTLGQIRLVEEDDWIAFANLDAKTHGADAFHHHQSIQIPRHWKDRLPREHCQLRIVEVEADDNEVRIGSIIRGGMSPGGIIRSFQVTQTPLSNPTLILLSAGRYSIEREVTAGLGLPRFDSRAWRDLCLGSALTGLLAILAGQILLDNGVPAGELIFIAGCLMLIPLAVKSVRGKVQKLRLDRLYSKATPSMLS